MLLVFLPVPPLGPLELISIDWYLCYDPWAVFHLQSRLCKTARAIDAARSSPGPLISSCLCFYNVHESRARTAPSLYKLVIVLLMSPFVNVV